MNSDSPYSRMVVIPESNYEVLIKKAETVQKSSDCLNATNTKQLNNLNVGQGGKVTVQYTEKGTPIKSGDASHVIKSDCKPTFDLPEPPSSEDASKPTAKQEEEEPVIPHEKSDLLDWGEMPDLPSPPISIIGDEAGEALASQRSRLNKLMGIGKKLAPSGINQIDIPPANYVNVSTDTEHPIFVDAATETVQPTFVHKATGTMQPTFADVATSTMQPTFADVATGTVQPTFIDATTGTVQPMHADVGTSMVAPSVVLTRGQKRQFELEATDILPPAGKRPTPLAIPKKRILRTKSVKKLPPGYIAPEHVPLSEQRVEEQEQINVTPEAAAAAYYPPLQKQMLAKMLPKYGRLRGKLRSIPYDASARPSAEQLKQLKTVPELAALPTLPIKLATIDPVGPTIDEIEEDLGAPSWQEPQDLLLKDEDIFSENLDKKRPLAIEFKPDKKATIITPPTSPEPSTSGLKHGETMQQFQQRIDGNAQKKRILPDWMLDYGKKEPTKNFSFERLAKNAKIVKKTVKSIKEKAKVETKPIWIDPSKLLQEDRGVKRKSKGIVLRHVKQRRHDDDDNDFV